MIPVALWELRNSDGLALLQGSTAGLTCLKDSGSIPCKGSRSSRSIHSMPTQGSMHSILSTTTMGGPHECLANCP